MVVISHFTLARSAATKNQRWRVRLTWLCSEARSWLDCLPVHSERQSTMGAAGRSLPSMVASDGFLTPSGSELSRLEFDRCSLLRLPAYFCCSPCFSRAL